MPRKKTLIIITVIGTLVIAGVYLSRAYDHIFSKIEAVGLTSPDILRTYALANKTATSTVTYVAMGDSLTAGVGADEYPQSFPFLLAERISAQRHSITLHDLAVPGAKTSDVLVKQLPQAIAEKPNIITILIGTNDIFGNNSAADFQTNYGQILRQLRLQTKADVYVISIPSVGARWLLLPPYHFYFDWRVRTFNVLLEGLAKKYQATYVDLYSPTVKLFQSIGPQYSADMFHPSAAGYVIWANVIYASIH